jgi:hypothetical protein
MRGRTKRSTGTLLAEADALSAFKWTVAGDGCANHLLEGAVFPDAAAARAGWETYRRAAWLTAHRLTVPPTARLYDGFTTLGRDLIWSTWNANAGLNLADVRRALAADEAAVIAFERANPAGAATMTDVLRLYREDLATLAAIASELAGDQFGGAIARLSTARTFGEAMS